MRGQIHVMLQEWLENTEKLALEELEKLTEDERRSPLTYNHYYTDNVQKSRLDTQKKALQSAVQAEHYYNGKLHISNVADDIERFVSAIGSHITVDMDEQACNNAITELRAYYKVKPHEALIHPLTSYATY
jgi:hypothetical protein